MGSSLGTIARSVLRAGAGPVDHAKRVGRAAELYRVSLRSGGGETFLGIGGNLGTVAGAAGRQLPIAAASEHMGQGEQLLTVGGGSHHAPGCFVSDLETQHGKNENWKFGLGGHLLCQALNEPISASAACAQEEGRGEAELQAPDVLLTPPLSCSGQHYG